MYMYGERYEICMWKKSLGSRNTQSAHIEMSLIYVLP